LLPKTFVSTLWGRPEVICDSPYSFWKLPLSNRSEFIFRMLTAVVANADWTVWR